MDRVLLQKPISEYPTLKPCASMDEYDHNLLNTFNDFIPYYWCLSEDVPSKIKLICMLNHWVSIPMALLDMSKLFHNKKLRRESSKLVNRVQTRVGKGE